ncbi:MAG TPA: AAA family ATPase [Steroidobacteraceae bacterium]|jgi:predicted kinase|nr:AAA family ATPase [Steroidobacteraceae bacterium]
MPHLLIVTGAPGSGKSRLAGALLDRVEARCCSKDEIKETLFDVLGSADEAWSRRLSDASFALMFQFAQAWLTAQGLLILEGNFRAGEHEARLQALLDRTGAHGAQVLCIAAPATRAERLAKRAADHTRHPAHQDNRISVQTGVGAAFLELPGPRFKFDSEAPWEREFTDLLLGLRNWYGLFKEL